MYGSSNGLGTGVVGNVGEMGGGGVFGVLPGSKDGVDGVELTTLAGDKDWVVFEHDPGLL
jgi:hypothetical protein